MTLADRAFVRINAVLLQLWSCMRTDLAPNNSKTPTLLSGTRGLYRKQFKVKWKNAASGTPPHIALTSKEPMRLRFVLINMSMRACASDMN